jgi:hypothetical protein
MYRWNQFNVKNLKRLHSLQYYYIYSMDDKKNKLIIT